MIVYGIPNCNTVKNALTWLKENGFEFEFHDFKKKGISADKLNEWCSVFGWETVLNKKGLTWKKSDPEEQGQVVDQQSAVNYLIRNTSAIKRPVIEIANQVKLISFDAVKYAQVLDTPGK